MPPIVNQTPHLESTNINIGGSVAARIARHQPSSTTSTSSTSTSTNDDGYGEYRNLCELRIRRLERYKKAKSFCSLESDDAINYGNLTTASAISTTALHSASTSTCSTVSSSSASSLSPAISNQQLSINTRPISTSSSASSAAATGGGQSMFESQVELLKQKMVSFN
uniref:Uncharacterized protein n=1 Tax=Panagrolaimus sp. ES5 TaxID=591445 RepID=A0AC34G4E9_9BILA